MKQAQRVSWQKKHSGLVLILLIILCGPVNAQTIDSFSLNRSPYPNELFVRLRFPDSTYELTRTFDRVALIYPPVNLTTFFYRSCQSVRTSPLRDTMIPIYAYDPYRIGIWLVRDSNTSNPDCVRASEIQNIDSVLYTPQQTSISLTQASNDRMAVFPNPANDLLHIAGSPGCYLQITDGLGRSMRRQKLQSRQETLDIRTLLPGLYYIHYYREGRRLQSLCFSKLP